MIDAHFLLSAVLAVLLLTVLIAWRSPLILFGAHFALGGVFRADAGSIVFILSWFSILFLAAIIFWYHKVRLDRFELVVDSLSKARWVIFALSFFGIIVLWAWQAGVNDLVSMKRVSESGAYANALNGLLTVYFIVAATVLMFYRRSFPRFLFWISVLIFAGFIFKSFLGSSRGAAFIPMLLIVFTRFTLIRRTSQVPKYMVLAISFVVIGGGFLASVTAQRAGIDGPQALAVLSLQLASPLGNGFSPLRDQSVIAHVENSGPLLSPTILLAPLYGFIPRFIWPDKPDVGVGRIIGTEVFGTGGGDYDRGAGVPISVPAQMEAIFGFGGYALGLLLVFLSLILLGLLAKKYSSLLLPLSLVAPSLMGSDLGRLGMQFIIVVLSLVTAGYILGVRLRYFSRDSRHVMRVRLLNVSARKQSIPPI